MKTRFIQIDTDTARSVLEKFKGQRVCDVVRRKIQQNLTDLVSYQTVQWSGSTDDYYFHISFAAGLLAISVEEREMQLKDSIPQLVALSHHLKGLNKVAGDPKAFQEGVDINIFYLKNVYKTDVETMSFKDVMRFLGWKFKSRKVSEQIYIE